MDQKTLLIIGGAAVAIYLITKKPAVALPTAYPGTLSASQYLQNQQIAQGNSTSAIISSAGTATGALLTGISNLFG